ncbi:hypothetical protein BD324DRAFT_657108 [Kockovaella imperatae]|uniref:C2H2-type domain-containing protein n=1 Tax=Kockovaella imperatae TaxID=4999 RepID=A0A1Y1UBY6_9TREE|nr:hypothetical protein BD324DRAFT_657108 [Kockovaella imperatae]ORX35551.1 hypothetical protein BD324DRAFT_657108 [Kockovaella imperatae]
MNPRRSSIPRYNDDDDDDDDDEEEEEEEDDSLDEGQFPTGNSAPRNGASRGARAGAGASGRASKRKSNGSAGQFKCDHPRCGKTFTRKDHLLRHAANHTNTNYPCPTCGRGFKRLDLLHRHEKRNICGDEASATSKRRRTSMTMSDNEDEDESPPPSIPSMRNDSLSFAPLPTLSLNKSPMRISGLNLGPLSAGSTTSFGQLTPMSVQATTLPLSASSQTIDPHAPHISSNTLHSELDLDPQPSVPFPTLPDFEVSTSSSHPQDWGLNIWQPDPWDALLHDTLAPPFNEPALTLDLPWNVSTPRMQESAERGGESLASAALIAKLQLAIPELDVNLSFLSDALSHYWSHVSPTFPFIHKGTFDINNAPAELVAMMAITGSIHLPAASRPDLRKVVQRIRGSLVQDCGLEMPVSTLQAFCLCHVHDTWNGTNESLFVAQCMWPVMVAHSRKKGIGVVGPIENEVQEEQAWAAWAKDEERRRAAFCVLLIDTQLSAFWNQHCSRQLSIFAHNIALPCPRNQWDAPTASEWFRLREASMPSPSTAARNSSRKAKTGYMPGLNPEFQVSQVSEGYSSSVMSALAGESALLDFPVDMEHALSVEMVLIGLMAVAWDCRTRGGMGIRFREGTKQWRTIVLAAVINLRAVWEMGVAHLPPSIESRDLRDSFAISVISVLSDIPMLQVAAGATSVCGSTIGPRQFKDAQRRLRIWGKTEDAWTCLWQSARYLRQALFTDWGIYSPWAVYMTVLVHWAYAWTLPNSPPIMMPTSPTSGFEPSASANQHQATVLLDHILTSATRLDNLDLGIAELISCTAEKLGAMGDIERENSALLWRLMGTNGMSQARRRSRVWDGLI